MTFGKDKFTIESLVADKVEGADPSPPFRGYGRGIAAAEAVSSARS